MTSSYTAMGEINDKVIETRQESIIRETASRQSPRPSSTSDKLRFATHSPEVEPWSTWINTPAWLSRYYHDYDDLPFYQPLIAPYQAADRTADSIFFFPFNYILMVCAYILGWPMMIMMTVLQFEIKHINTPISRYFIPWAGVKSYLATTHPRWGWFVWWSVVATYYSALTPLFVFELLTCYLPVLIINFFWLPMVVAPVFNVMVNTFLAMLAWWGIVLVARGISATFEFFWGYEM